MPKRTPKTAAADILDAAPDAGAAEAPAKPAPRRRSRKAEAAPAPAAELDVAEAMPALEIEAAPGMEPEAEAPAFDPALAGLPPEIAAMLAAASAEAAEAAAPAADAVRLALPAVLDLTAASDLREALLGHRGGPLVLDGSGVERLGGQCLQLLLSARATWAADERELSLAEPSASLLRDLSILGVEPSALSTRELA